MLRFRISFLCIGLLSLISFGAQAETTTTTTVVKRVITTPAPKAVCTSVVAHWEGNTWVDTHDICKYENRSEGVAWVNDYWSCTEAAADGSCKTWSLVPGHWVTSMQ
jgi:hypothetical protein